MRAGVGLAPSEPEDEECDERGLNGLIFHIQATHAPSSRLLPAFPASCGVGRRNVLLCVLNVRDTEVRYLQWFLHPKGKDEQL